MGWSCSAAVGVTMERWTAACLESTKSQNEWEQGGRRYFWELSVQEHDDGAATGEVFELRATLAYPAGSFRIEGDGSVTRAPKFLRDAANRARRAGDLEVRR